MKRWKWLLTIILLIALGGTALFYQMDATMKKADAFQVTALSLDELADGVYEGESDWNMVKVKVRVYVHDHTLHSIDLLEHQNVMGDAAQAILSDILSKNSTDVDVISGSTISSKAIQNAVQKALQ